MKFFVIKDLNDQEFDKFIEFLNKIDLTKDRIALFIDSQGGDTSAKDALVKIINGNKSSFFVTVLLAMSNAFELLLEIKCPIIMLKGGYGMVHKGAWSVALRDGGRIHGEFSEFQKREMERYNEIDRSFLVKEELAIYEDGRDVYLSSDRIKGIFLKIGKEYNQEDDSFITPA